MRFAVVLASIAMFACAENGGGSPTPAPVNDSYRAISTLDEFNNLVVGRKLTYQGTNTFTVRSNGTLDGDFAGPLAGSWRWEEGYWCRTLEFPQRPEDCQLWETDGTTLRATRAKGTGTQFVYEL